MTDSVYNDYNFNLSSSDDDDNVDVTTTAIDSNNHDLINNINHLSLHNEQQTKVHNFLHNFKILSMTMSDAYNKKNVLWSSKDEFNNIYNLHTTQQIIDIRLSKSILKLQAVSRCMIFSVSESISKFSIIQYIEYNDNIIETWSFNFGFVIPNSTNEWDNIIEKENKSIMKPEQLSGQLYIRTVFYDDNIELCKLNIRIFYV